MNVFIVPACLPLSCRMACAGGAAARGPDMTHSPYQGSPSTSLCGGTPRSIHCCTPFLTVSMGLLALAMQRPKICRNQGAGRVSSHHALHLHVLCGTLLQHSWQQQRARTHRLRAVAAPNTAAAGQSSSVPAGTAPV